MHNEVAILRQEKSFLSQRLKQQGAVDAYAQYAAQQQAQGNMNHAQAAADQNQVAAHQA